MDELLEYLIYRFSFKTQDLVNSSPPKLDHPHKNIVYEIACPPDSIHKGKLEFSRWYPIPLPDIMTPAYQRIVWEARTDYFGYEPNSNLQEIDWYLNFADPDLFVAYGSPLFAQDEIQVAEHPALASLREALLNAKIKPLTVEDGNPTPILIRGVERRCAIAIDPNSEQERPLGLYGNKFARATPNAIALATKLINPPTMTNLIAIAAPRNKYGFYAEEEIENILLTAFTGFLAAKIDSSLLSSHPRNVVIHTGFWGCGAFGGNRVLMALLQLIAAMLAEIDRLVFHTGDSSGLQSFRMAQQILDEELIADSALIEISTLIENIYEMRFQWGISDGN